MANPRIRFLLADDPGAGKTIMAGLILKELKQRGLVQRVLIVIPGHLKDQWIREMKEKFGETFRVIDRAVMDASYGRNVWRDENQALTSMDFAKQEDVIGHSVSILLKRLPKKYAPNEGLINQAKILDRHYHIHTISKFSS